MGKSRPKHNRVYASFNAWHVARIPEHLGDAGSGYPILLERTLFLPKRDSETGRYNKKPRLVGAGTRGTCGGRYQPPAHW